MKKINKFLKMFLLFFLLFLPSCINIPIKPRYDNPMVEKVEILKYQDSIIIGESFDEESAEIKVFLRDGTSGVYSGEDLDFDYSNFDNLKYGEQKIKIKIKPLDISETITVSVYKEIIKILMISNSFGDDTVQWVNEIGNDLNIGFTISNLYIGGCVLSTHLSNLKNDSPAYEYISYDKKVKTWSRTKDTKISTAIALEDWDYVVLQQGSHDSGRSETYGAIDEIMNRVLELKGDVEFMWNMTWAYQQNSGHANFHLYNNDQLTMYNAIVNSVQEKIVPNERFKYIIPNGTAIQNARTSRFGDTLCRDEYCHLTLDLGRYIAGLTLVATVADVDIKAVDYSPNLKSKNKKIAIESVVNAMANPFEITQSIY